MHDTCSFVFDALWNNGPSCDCTYFGFLLGLFAFAFFEGFCSVASYVIKRLRNWIKSKKKPDSQA